MTLDLDLDTHSKALLEWLEARGIDTPQALSLLGFTVEHLCYLATQGNPQGALYMAERFAEILKGSMREQDENRKRKAH